MRFPFFRFLLLSTVATLLISQVSAQVVEIPDSNLRAAIREELKLPNGTPITQQEMLRLTRLEAGKRGITDLTHLEYAANLKWLNLGHNQIRDISLLTNLIQLEKLWLEVNTITDITPLANLVQLEKLWLEHNAITDITPLGNLTQLQFLHLTDNSIEDITILTNLIQLVELSVAANQIRDISPLANLVRLEKLWLNINAITDITPLVGLKNLKVLHLADNPIHDFTPLANHPNLEGLDIRGTLVTDLSPLNGINLIGDILHSPCDIPPLPPPLRERIENRTFPSVFQAWDDVIDPNRPIQGPRGYEYEQRAAMHDLSWGPFFWITSNWGTNATERVPNWGLATSLTTENAPQSRQRFLTQNPNHVFLAQVNLHYYASLEALPPDSDFWLRDASGKILRLGYEVSRGEYLIDFVKPEVQDLLIKRILAIGRCGFYDGVFLDNFFLHAKGFVETHGYTHEEIIQAHTNIFQAVRAQARDDFLIIVNASSTKLTRYTEFINGTWMETTQHMEIVSDNWDDDPLFRLQQQEGILAWVQENLRPPQITCLQGEGIPQGTPRQSNKPSLDAGLYHHESDSF